MRRNFFLFLSKKKNRNNKDKTGWCGLESSRGKFKQDLEGLRSLFQGIFRWFVLHLQHIPQTTWGTLWAPQAPELWGSPSASLAESDRLELALILNVSTELNEINLLVQRASSNTTQLLRIILACDVVEWMLNEAVLKIQTWIIRWSCS